MENLNLADLYLSQEESRDLIKFLARKRNIKNYISKLSNELLKPIKKQSKNKKRIDTITEELKDLSYKLSRNELKEIKKNLYNIEKKSLNQKN